jgi:Zn-dependent oligopeptidase
MVRMAGAPFFDYTTVTPDETHAAGEAAIARADAILDGIARVPPAERTFANTVLPLDEVRALLSLAGGRYGFLSSVAPDAALRDAAREVEQRLDTYSTTIGFREDIFVALRD